LFDRMDKISLRFIPPKSFIEFKDSNHPMKPHPYTWTQYSDHKSSGSKSINNNACPSACPNACPMGVILLMNCIEETDENNNGGSNPLWTQVERGVPANGTAAKWFK
jgi:hypothetical protein